MSRFSCLFGVAAVVFAACSLVAHGEDGAALDSRGAAEELLRLFDELQRDPVALEAVRVELRGRATACDARVREAAEQKAALDRRAGGLNATLTAKRLALSELDAVVVALEAEAAAVAKELEANAAETVALASAQPILNRTLNLLDAAFGALPASPGPEVEPVAAAPAVTPPVEPSVVPAVLSAEQRMFVEKQVLGTLAANCFGCHGEEKQESGMRLDSLAGMLRGGERGPAIVVGQPDESRLVSVIRREGELKMPPEHGLDAESVAVLAQWIALGAPWPDDLRVPAPRPAKLVIAPKPTPAPAVQVAPEVAPEVASAPEVSPVPETPPAPKKPPVRKRKRRPADVVPASTAVGTINFNRDIRPILSNNCFACHGPDGKSRKADLRLDQEADLFSVSESGEAIVAPGDRATSELFHRVTTEDESDRMPPEESGKTLTPAQVELLGKWIDEGAQWEGHWSFIAPVRPALPAVTRGDWIKNPIDTFVAARLDAEGLAPSDEADRRTLLRRVSFDLTGLPPTLEELDAFVGDDAPDAYETVVDRLLDSPRYGEHMARFWLDLARYADTNGYHIDNERFMWRWRDWVIDAFNTNMPFDQFTIEQLAGDLLPDSTLDQQIASGFNRNHMINFEGGAIPEEYRVQYVVDRLDATSTVWMGLTVACAQCHDHKFDPISQKDFYSMFAFFNTVPEEGLDGREGNAAPFVKAPLPEQVARMKELDAEIAVLRGEMNRPIPELDARQAVWEEDWSGVLQSRWEAMPPREVTAKEGATLTLLDDGSVLASGENPAKEVYEYVAEISAKSVTAMRLEILADASFTEGAAGRAEDGDFVLTEFEVEIASKDAPDDFRQVPIELAVADFEQAKFGIDRVIDGKISTGWGVEADTRRENRTAVFKFREWVGGAEGSLIRVRLRHQSRFEQHAIGRFRLSLSTEEDLIPARLGPWFVNGPFMAEDGNAAYETAYEPESGVDLEATYDDGRRKWIQVMPGYRDGSIHNLFGDIAATYLYRTIRSSSPRRVTLSLGSNDANKVWVNGEVVYDNNVQRGIEADQDTIEVTLHEGENDFLMKVVNYGASYAFYFKRTAEEIGDMPFDIEMILAKDPAERSDGEGRILTERFRKKESPEWRELDVKLAGFVGEKRDLDAAIPTTMVMGEMDVPRESFVLMRGQYDRQGEKVEAGVPDAFPPLPEGAPSNRLGFAQWLVSPEHPLTSRVVVNRFWQQYFGRGIVKTSEDFGVQGEWPTHPQLLDWLSREFIDGGWDVKALQRLIVTSAVYRQDSRRRPGLQERDPENLLLARGPRMRLDAEMLRDNALAVSGLLVEKVGGPSVKPYQPKGIWEEVAYGAGFTAQTFERDSGDGLYRRSMYTFWKRQAPPPQMLLFDAPSRETCTSRRALTNTPLQALALLNDPQYVEASRALAERAMTRCGDEVEAFLDYAFMLATARPPTVRERDVLVGVYRAQLAEFGAHPEDAEKLLAIGEYVSELDCDRTSLAAWTTVAAMILNLDETVTKS